MKQLLKKQGFTLVELIIVIAIIAVLAVAAFMMLTKWLGKSRDSRRLSDLETIQKGLDVGYTDEDMGNGLYPDISGQEERVALMSGGDIVGYQGIVDLDVATLANLQKVPLDPSDKNEYTYTVTANRKKSQVMTMLEDGTEATALVNNVFALDYSNRIPVVKGFKIGVFLDGDNLPLQYVGEYQNTGVNLMNEIVTANFRAIVGENEEYTGTAVISAPIMDEGVGSGGGATGTDSVCGSDNGGSFESEPTNLCSVGTETSVTDGGIGNQYTWICESNDGGGDVNCSADHIFPAGYWTDGTIITYNPDTNDDIGSDPSKKQNRGVTYCNDLILGGHDDWYLPSKEELLVLYNNKDSIGASLGTYWAVYDSDSTHGSGRAWMMFFSGSDWYESDKNNASGIRCIRSSN